MFIVDKPLTTSIREKSHQLAPVLNAGVNLADADARLFKSMQKNRTRRKRSAARARQTMKY